MLVLSQRSPSNQTNTPQTNSPRLCPGLFVCSQATFEIFPPGIIPVVDFYNWNYRPRKKFKISSACVRLVRCSKEIQNYLQIQRSLERIHKLSLYELKWYKSIALQAWRCAVAQSKREAQRQAARRTVETGRVHEVSTRRGFFSDTHSVKDTHKTANPVQRREALRNRNR